MALTATYFYPLWRAVYQRAFQEAALQPGYDPYRAGRHLWTREKEAALFRELFPAVLAEAARNGLGGLSPQQVLDAGLNFFNRPELGDLGVVAPGAVEAEARRAAQVQEAVAEAQRAQQQNLSPLQLWRARGGRFAWEEPETTPTT